MMVAAKSYDIKDDKQWVENNGNTIETQVGRVRLSASKRLLKSMKDVWSSSHWYVSFQTTKSGGRSMLRPFT